MKTKTLQPRWAVVKNVTVVLALLSGSACTEQIPGGFRFLQQEEAFRLNGDLNTKVDMLWVVDNSASMDASQEKLRAGFQQFAQTYMKPTWDIRVGVITTDTYLANSAFSSYISSTIPGSTGWTASAHIQSLIAASKWTNPSWNTGLVNLATGLFNSGAGLRYSDAWPLWDTNYAKLIAGKHDGPTTSLCFERNQHFYSGATSCATRDDSTAGTGTTGCTDPNTGAGQSSLSQCVNTVQNDTVRTGKGIIETIPPSGTPANAAWEESLLRNFMVNLTTGSAGHGSERGLASVAQLMTDNEAASSGSVFFRKGSLRVIIFLSDEDDQSMELPSPIPGGFTPTTYYSAANCSAKVVDSHTYTLSTCPEAARLRAVSSYKSDFDNFFKGLEGGGEATPNYFIVNIVPLSGTDISSLQATRDANDTTAGVTPSVAVDRGDRYIELASLVGNGSLNMSIASSNYSSVLDAIGVALAKKKGTFTLKRAPTDADEIIFKIIHASGATTEVTKDMYTISGNEITLNSVSFILSLSAADIVVINYQPKSAY